MTKIRVKDLGIEIDESKLLEMVAENIANQALGRYSDDDGNWIEDSKTEREFMSRFDAMVKIKIDEAIEKIAGKNVLPHIGKFIEDYCLQETSKWGEKKGEKVTFTEYLVQRAQAYLEESVDYSGKPKNTKDGYGFRPKSTRVVFMIEQHLHHEIETAMTAALNNGLGSLAKSLVETTRHSVNEAAKKLRVDVKTQ